MGFLRGLPLPFTSVQGTYSPEPDESVSMVTYIRLVLSLTADLAIVGWAMAFVGRSKGCPPWLAFTMAVGIFALAACVYYLSANEFHRMVTKDNSKLKRAARLIIGFAFVQLISVVPAIYGIATGRP
ncbi:hypothetical protein [Pseudogulbenkiania ferrooxidans]|uniref:hypothetical protein n=1 Tax=Pseudogulbenkiania ferrooxidans TaxID=549169 RepID=UPI0012688585|nr:hypothetical protein [Pseudogulbenkiania ferrooxidans]